MSLDKIKLTPNFRSINLSGFQGCLGATKLIIPRWALKVIGNQEFAKCNKISKKTEIPDNVTNKSHDVHVMLSIESGNPSIWYQQDKWWTVHGLHWWWWRQQRQQKLKQWWPRWQWQWHWQLSCGCSGSGKGDSCGNHNGGWQRYMVNEGGDGNGNNKV